MKTRVNRISPVSVKLAEISALESKLTALRNEASETLTATLRGLPASLGYDNADSLIKAIRAANKTKTRKVKASRKASGARKARASITPEKRAAIIADLTAKMAPLDVATKHEISLATVQNVKKAAGLVKVRKADATPAPAAVAAS